MQRWPILGFRLAALLGGIGLGALAGSACSGAIARGSDPGETEDDEPGSDGGEGGSVLPPDGPIPPASQVCNTTKPTAGDSHWRRLTAQQYQNTVRDLLGQEVDVSLFLSDTTTGRFTTNSLMATPDAQVLRYHDTAGKVAGEAVRDLRQLLACDPQAVGEDDCASRFIADFGARAWRRPLDDTDRKLLNDVYQEGKKTSFAAGIRLVVAAVLQSPSFLYLVELGGQASEGVAALTDHEIASRLSYVLWDTMPDADLFVAASAGELKDPQALRQQAERMMGDPRFTSVLGRFHEQLLGTDAFARPGGVTRDKTHYPQWSDALGTAMREETRRFVSAVFDGGEGTIEALLSAPFASPSGPLVELYGSGGQWEGDDKLTFSDGSRRGILTHAATLTAADPADSLFRAVLRGKLIRTEIFCEHLPPVPGDVEFKQPEGADQMTQQELLRVHQEDPSCKGCHEQMDPLGFALESYDGIGRFRTKHEDGDAVDTSGTIVGTDVEGPFADTAAFIEKIASSRDVRGCFARQWFRFALARDAADADACTLAKIRDVLVQGGGSLRDALLVLVTSDGFRYKGGF